MHRKGRALSELRDYIDELAADAQKGLPRGRFVRFARSVVPHRVRQDTKVWVTDALRPLERRKAERMQQQQPLRLHLGAGDNHKAGWLNIDTFGMPAAELRWDLRRPLPFSDGVADAVFTEHVLEHFSIGGALEMLRECARVLKPRGLIRVGVPDLGAYARSYAGDRAFLQTERPDRPTPLLAMAEVVYRHGHRSAWDGETLVCVLRSAGFGDAAVRAFGESELDAVPDSESRRAETVYAEAHKG